MPEVLGDDPPYQPEGFLSSVRQNQSAHGRELLVRLLQALRRPVDVSGSGLQSLMPKLPHKAKNITPRTEVSAGVRVTNSMRPNIPAYAGTLGNLQDQLTDLTSGHGFTGNGQKQGCIIAALPLVRDIPLEHPQRLTAHCDESNPHLAILNPDNSHIPVNGRNLD